MPWRTAAAAPRGRQGPSPDQARGSGTEARRGGLSIAARLRPGAAKRDPTSLSEHLVAVRGREGLQSLRWGAGPGPGAGSRRGTSPLGGGSGLPGTRRPSPAASKGRTCRGSCTFRATATAPPPPTRPIP